MPSEINDEVTIAEGGDGIESAMNRIRDPRLISGLFQPSLYWIIDGKFQGTRKQIPFECYAELRFLGRCRAAFFIYFQIKGFP